MVNSCRHRGAEICPQGSGQRQDFQCPYHGWTYDCSGQLRSVRRPDHFGEITPSYMSLILLPCEERYGIIWSVLTPGSALDVDAWLGPFAPHLSGLALGHWRVHDQYEIAGANWKATFEGYLEGYHTDVLHRKTVGADILPNLATVDVF